MKTSPAGRALIHGFEGCKLQAYQDGADVWTIGMGHTRGVKKGMVCNIEQAQIWLVEDLEDAEADVERLVTVPLNQNQFDALVSFVFNLGGTKLAGSTLLKHLNAGRYKEAAGQFKLWKLVAGKPSNGLVRRRAAETDLFLKEIK